MAYFSSSPGLSAGMNPSTTSIAPRVATCTKSQWICMGQENTYNMYTATHYHTHTHTHTSHTHPSHTQNANLMNSSVSKDFELWRVHRQFPCSLYLLIPVPHLAHYHLIWCCLQLHTYRDKHKQHMYSTCTVYADQVTNRERKRERVIETHRKNREDR